MKPKLKSLGESRDTSEAEHDYEYDEKHKTVAPTEAGVEKAEQFLGVENLYVSEHGTLVNHLIQSLKAESLFKRDKDYAVIDGEVKIIDEFTGRILEGRRWSDGLHQAVEAKEGVPIREENQTLATITLQNYFRLYDKLGGMTGTALTEAQEFMKIYEMPVVEIPTHRPMVRADHNDQIYKTKQGKWKAVVNEIARAPRERPADPRRHDLGRDLRDALRRAHPPRDRARGAEREARVRRSARARRSRRPAASVRSRSPPTWPGAASTSSSAATPSSSRSDELRQARAVSPATRAGTRRWPSRPERVRGAVRGRGRRRCASSAASSSAAPSATSRAGSTTSCAAAPGRQGDPGESRFFLSAEDDLIRLFAGRADLQDPRPPRPRRRRGRGVPARGEDADAHDRERAEEGRAAELPDPQARARVRRRHERAAPRRLQVPARDPRGPRHVRRRPRRARGGGRPPGRDVHPGRDVRGLGPRQASRATRAASGRSASPSARSRRAERRTARRSPSC